MFVILFIGVWLQEPWQHIGKMVGLYLHQRQFLQVNSYWYENIARDFILRDDMVVLPQHTPCLIYKIRNKRTALQVG